MESSFGPINNNVLFSKRPCGNGLGFGGALHCKLHVERRDSVFKHMSAWICTLWNTCAGRKNKEMSKKWNTVPKGVEYSVHILLHLVEALPCSIRPIFSWIEKWLLYSRSKEMKNHIEALKTSIQGEVLIFYVEQWKFPTDIAGCFFVFYLRLVLNCNGKGFNGVASQSYLIARGGSQSTNDLKNGIYNRMRKNV